MQRSGGTSFGGFEYEVATAKMQEITHEHCQKEAIIDGPKSMIIPSYQIAKWFGPKMLRPP